MPLPPPKRIDDLPHYMIADSSAVLKDCKENYKKFIADLKHARDLGEIARLSRSQRQAIIAQQQHMKNVIFTLEIAVTEASN